MVLRTIISITHSLSIGKWSKHGKKETVLTLGGRTQLPKDNPKQNMFPLKSPGVLYNINREVLSTARKILLHICTKKNSASN